MLRYVNIISVEKETSSHIIFLQIEKWIKFILETASVDQFPVRNNEFSVRFIVRKSEKHEIHFDALWKVQLIVLTFFDNFSNMETKYHIPVSVHT